MEVKRWGSMGASCLLTVVLAGGCGGSGSEHPQGKPASALAEQANLAGIHSGEAEVILTVADLAKREKVRMDSRALFVDLGKEDPPRFDVSIQSHGELGGREAGFFGAFLLLPDHAVLYYRGQTYRPPASFFARLKSKFQQAQKEVGVGNPMACVEALQGERVVDLFRGLRTEGRRKDHDGTPVTLIGGELDPDRLLDALVRMSGHSGCRAQMKAIGLPTGAQLEAVGAGLVDAVESGRAQLALDAHRALRDLSVEVQIRVPGGDRFKVEFTWLLEHPNGLDELPRPAAEGRFPVLLKQFGTDLPTVQAANGNQLLVGLLQALAKEMTGR